MQRFRKYAGIVLLVAGLLLLAYSFFPDLLMWWRSDDSQQMLDDASAAQMQANGAGDGEIDFLSIDDISASTAWRAGDIDPSLLVGQLVIPDIDLNLPIFKSLNNTTLMSGAAVMKNQQIMGEGNYALAGHYTHTSGNLFGPLRSIKKGASIRLTDKEKIYEYKYVDYQVTASTATEMIEDEQADNYDAPIISLMRCHYVNFQKQPGREFYIGELVDVYDYSAQALFE